MTGPPETHYELQVISYQDDQGTRRAHSLKLDVLLRGIRQGTLIVKKDGSLESNHRITFSTPNTSDELSIRVKRRLRNPWRYDHADIRISLSDLLDKCAVGEVSLHLRKESTKSCGIVQVFLKDIDEEERVGFAFEDVAKRIEKIMASAERAGHPVTQLADVVRTLDEVVNAVDAAVKVNTYLNLTWQIVSVVYRVVSNQFKKDQKLLSLVQSMKETFQFASDAKSLSDKAEKIKGGYKEALDLTLECCRFIQQYADGKFVERVLKLGTEQKIDDYIQSFDDLKGQIDRGIMLHIASRIGAIDMRQQLDTLANKLEPGQINTSLLPRCLAGTRTRYLEAIQAWRVSESSKNIFWLNGIAGSGKSTIAATIRDDCARNECLAAFIFFRRETKEHESIIRTIACQLAEFSSRIAENIISAANRFRYISGDTPKTQFETLLLVPLTLSSQFITGPITIILDALDECGSESQRREILELLGYDFSKLPMKFRFFVTSRPENDIINSLTSRKHISELKLDNATSDARGDVNKYLVAKVRDIFQNEPCSWSQRDVEALGDIADGLFIWASTAIKVIRETDDPPRKLKGLLANVRSVGMHGIDGLYETVLEESGISWNDDVSRTRFKRVLGVVLFAKDKLSAEDIEKFLGLEQGAIIRTIGRLRSVLFYDSGAPVRLHHASFFDYLTTRERSGVKAWHIDEDSQKRTIAERCLNIMEKGLRFNDCRIESPFVRNEDIPGFEECVKKYIPRHLEYACRFWAAHVCDLSMSIDEPVLLEKLRSFTYERLFYWFEVLSLTERFNTAADTLKKASDWIKTADADVASFLQDASELADSAVDTFADVISQNTPHSYLSALSLSKFDYRVAEHYSETHPIVSVSMREAAPDHQSDAFWPHRSVSHASFSADGSRVACPSMCGQISIWDINSGGFVTLLTGHGGEVTSVAFFPDGKRVVSGSQDGIVRIRDIDTGEYIMLSSDMGPIRSLAVSANGKFAVSDSETVHIWNAGTRERIGIFKVPHSLLAGSPVIAFSPNGSHVASGCRDGTVRIWNVRSCAFVANPFRGHTGEATSLVFSPDGTCVVSASLDKTLRMWNAFNGNLVAGPFVGHTEAVTSVVFSPDGKYVASGSRDRSVRIWDAATAQLIASPFYGHASHVASVTWSGDGTRIISSSFDGTVRIWDVHKLLPTQDADDKCREDIMPTRTSPSNAVLVGAAQGETSPCIPNTTVNRPLSPEGWALGEQSELLLWLPRSMRSTLWVPHTIALISIPYETRLEFANALRKIWQNLPGHRAAHDERSIPRQKVHQILPARVRSIKPGIEVGEQIVNLEQTRRIVMEALMLPARISARSNSLNDQYVGDRDVPAVLDLAIVLDTTISMVDYIGISKKSIYNICNTLRGSGRLGQGDGLQVGLVAYRDYPEDKNEYVFKSYPFTNDLDALEGHFATLQPSGGLDLPEAFATALDCAYNMDGWRDDSVKVIIVITDAAPHGIKEKGDNYPEGDPEGNICDPLQLARDMAKAGYSIFTLACEPRLGKTTTYAMDFYRAISDQTLGRFCCLTDHRMLPECIIGALLEKVDLRMLSVQCQERIQQRILDEGRSMDQVVMDLHEELVSKNQKVTNMQIDEIYEELPDAHENYRAFIESRTLADAREKLKDVNVSRVSDKVIMAIQKYKRGFVTVRLRHTGAIHGRIALQTYDESLRPTCLKDVIRDGRTIEKMFRLHAIVNFSITLGRKSMNFSRVFVENATIDVDAYFI